MAPGGLDEAEQLNALGDIAARERKFEAASDYQHEALTLSEKIAPKGDVTIQALQSLGKIETDREKYTPAREFYLRALEIQQQSPTANPLDTARTLQGLGELSAREGSFKGSSRLPRTSN